MRLPLVLAALALATPASAQPPRMSQHPRSGELAEVAFQPGSSELPSAANVELGEVAGWALEHPDGRIVLDGYPDRADDVRLALRRVEIVRDALIGAGVDPDQLVVAAFDHPAKRRVIVTATHQDLDAIVASRDKAAAVMWGDRNLHPTVAGR